MKDVVAENDKTVDGMTRDGKRSKKEAETRYRKSMKTSTCKNSGRKHGVKQACPAQGKLCFKCNKPNHYQRMCRSKAVHECDLFIRVVKNEGEDEVSVSLGNKFDVLGRCLADTRTLSVYQIVIQ